MYGIVGVDFSSETSYGKIDRYTIRILSMDTAR